MSAEQLKQQGNQAFSSGDYENAIKFFSEAIDLDPQNHVLFSNRSACHCSLKNYEKALEDAEKCVSIKPDWSKGFGRVGAALLGLKKYREAKAAYEKGLSIDPNNEQLKKGLQNVQEIGGTEGLNAMFQIFNDPKSTEKLMNHPKTKPYMAQADFVQMLDTIKKNPQSLQMFLTDQRMVQALTVLMGINVSESEDMAEDAPEPAQPEPPKPEPVKKEEPKPQPKTQPKQEEKMETDSVSPQRKEAEAEKEKGTQLYKKKDFQGALQHYEKAWEIDSTNIVYLNNIAAVYFEMKDFDKCIETCQKAVEEGRSLRADYQVIAKSFARIGNAYMKKEDYDQAINFFGKSLAEHRAPDIQAKYKEAQKLKEKKDKEAYINPSLANEARERGNGLFKEQNFAGAVKEYTEATLRNPKDPKNFSNRAAAYTKLMAFPEALKDCDLALALDPDFVKAYLRKANIQIAMRKFGEALRSLEDARSRDKEGVHAVEISELESKCGQGMGSLSEEEVAENARNDPEIAQILGDPVMRSILEQMQTDPRALADHLKNPAIAKKIQKLMDAGILRVGGR